jgi:hypothetical protein
LFLKCGKASCGDVENVPNPLKLCWLWLSNSFWGSVIQISHLDMFI